MTALPPLRSAEALPARPTLTVAVVSRNEGSMLDVCLQHVSGADEILVLDMESTDDTQAIAAKHGARVVPVPISPIVERVRQLGVRAASSDWLLWLDTDEVPPGALDELLGPFLTDPDHAAFWVPFLDVAFGHPVPVASSGAVKICLVRPTLAFWPPGAPAHTQPTINGSVGSLLDQISPFTHNSLRSVDQWLEKTARYAQSGGATVGDVQGADPLLLPKLLWRAYLGRRAWLDGTPGTASANLGAISDYLAHLKSWEAAGSPRVVLPTRQSRALALASLAVQRSRPIRRALARLALPLRGARRPE